jgi:hypothetical protein
LGTFLRAFTFGHLRQLDAVHARTLAGLATAVPRLLAGAEAMAFIDIDDTIREVHGYRKQGAAYGYSGVKGVNAQIAALSSPTCAPVTAGPGSARATPPPGTARTGSSPTRSRPPDAAGAAGRVMVRAGSGYYRQDVVAAAIRAKAQFSVTVRMNPSVQKDEDPARGPPQVRRAAIRENVRSCVIDTTRHDT